MLNEMKREPYACLKEFSHLNGWEKPEVFVGTQPDARTGKLLFKTKALHQWNTHWPSKFKEGYITFENGKRFDKANQTINGKTRYIFDSTPEMEVLWRHQVVECKVRDLTEKASMEEKAVVAELVWERVGQNDLVPSSRRLREETAIILSGTLSVRDLEDLAALLMTDCGGQAAAAPGCAA